MLIRSIVAFIKEFWIPVLVVLAGVTIALVYNANLKASYTSGYLAAKDKYERVQRESDAEAQKKIAAIDKEWTEKNEDARKENDALRTSIASGASRVYIRARCPAEGSIYPGVGNDPSYAELDGAAAQRIIDIANDGDDAIRQLTSAQDIIRALSVTEPK